MSAVHVGAVPVDTVACPEWCAVPKADHLADLPNWEGRVLHWSVDHNGDGWTVRQSASTYANGVHDETDPPLVWVDVHTDGISPASARALADQLHKLT
jgi:hypothetical protein